MKEGRHFAFRQSQGARDYQEDDAGFCPIARSDGNDGLLMVLADGMGGHRGGAHASRVAVETFIDTFNRENGPVQERLDRALFEANEQIGEDSRANPELEGMGCTLVGVALMDGAMEYVSVGDSPMWLYRDGGLKRVNEDHSMAPILAMQVERGELTAEEAARHPQRNALRSAVIGDKMQHIDRSTRPLKIRRGDRVVLSSDGLETLSEDDIVEIIAATPDGDAKALAERLVTEVDARQRKGQDNTTVMIVDPFVGGDDAMSPHDPDGPTERITRRTITPRMAEGKTKAKSGGRGGLWALLLVLIAAGAAAGWFFRDEVRSLISGTPGGTATTATTGTTGGNGSTAAGTPGTTSQGSTGGGTGGGGTGGGTANGGTASGGTARGSTGEATPGGGTTGGSTGGSTAAPPGGSTAPPSGGTGSTESKDDEVAPGTKPEQRGGVKPDARPRRAEGEAAKPGQEARRPENRQPLKRKAGGAGEGAKKPPKPKAADRAKTEDRGKRRPTTGTPPSTQ